MVGPADELQFAPGGPPDHVPRAVHPRPRRTERVGHEPVGGQPGPRQVAAGQSATGHVQFARDPRRHRTQVGAQHVHPGVPDRPTDGHRFAGHQRTAPGGHHGGLGRTVGVDHPTARCPAPHQLRGAGVPADHQGPQVRQRRARQGRQGSRRDQCVRHPVLGEHLGQVLTEQGPARRHDQGRTEREGHAQFQDRGVEAG